MNVQLIANEENQDRAQSGKNEAGGMKPFVRRAEKQMRDGAPDNRPDDTEHDRPEDRYVHVHHRFRNNPRDQPDQNIPDQMKHTFFSIV
jgi:hypothetical protein